MTFIQRAKEQIYFVRTIYPDRKHTINISSYTPTNKNGAKMEVGETYISKLTQVKEKEKIKLTNKWTDRHIALHCNKSHIMIDR